MTTIQLRNITGSAYIDRFTFAQQIPWNFSFPNDTFIFSPLAGHTVRDVIESVVRSIEIRYEIPSVNATCTLSGCSASAVPVKLLVVLEYIQLYNRTSIRVDEFELDALMDISAKGKRVNVSATVAIPILTVLSKILKGSTSPLDHGVIDIGIWTLGITMDHLGIPRVYDYTVEHVIEL